MDLINLYAESGRDIIGDDAQPTLTLKNTSTGAGLEVDSLVVTGTASISTSESGTIQSGASNSPILTLSKSVIGTYTAPSLVLPVASVASGAAIQLGGTGFVSAVSLIFAAGSGWAGMGAIRVRRTDDSFGWIPVLPDSQVTAAVFE